MKTRAAPSFILMAFFAFCSHPAAGAGEPGEKVAPAAVVLPASSFRQANALYHQGEYQPAAAIYEGIIRGGWESAALYYNLGNAYFKQQDLGRAILNYRRAWNLSPRDPEINKNLEYAQEARQDDISALPAGFFQRLKLFLVRQLPLSVWLKLSSVIYFISMFWILLVLLIKPLRKISPPVLKTLGAVFALSLLLSALAYSDYRVPRAIILEDEISARYGPHEEDAVAFQLHQGTEVRIVRRQGEWFQVALPDGNSGWLPAGALEII